MRLAGMMSGTSLDGIDVAIVDLERNLERSTLRRPSAVKVMAFETVAFEPHVRATIISALPPRSGSVRDVCVLNMLIGEAFATALLDVARRSHIDMETIDAIGSHGHTLRHIPVDDGAKPFAPSTLQVGDPAVIAARTGVTCVGDFRVADIAAGGQGAPLASYVDFLLLRSASEFRVALNIGGIANLTLLPRNCSASEVIAFDSGPGNVLIDACARFATDGKLACDEDGRLARQGKIDEQLLQALLDHPFYRTKPPKTAGREQFGEQYATAIWQQGRGAGLPANDVLATVTALTARTLAAAVPATCDRVIVSGGGAHNPVLMDSLRLLQPTISSSDEFGLPVDGKEAIVFAVLAFEALAGQPNNLPSATGAAQPVVMGKIAPGKNFTGHVGIIRMSEPVAIGVDVGASGTRAVLVDRAGKAVARTQSGGANARSVGEETAAKNLAQALEPLLRPGVRCVCIGAAGVARERDYLAYVALAERVVGPNVRLIVRHDAQIALRAATAVRPAVVVLAGTGSFVYGQRSDGSSVRAGGYGAVLGDDGSRYAMGLAALRHCARSLDGVDESGFLAKAICDELGVKTSGEIIERVHHRPPDVAFVASLADLLGKAFEHGDPAARSIVATQGNLLGDCAAAVARAVRNETVLPLVLSGGAFHAIPALERFVADAAQRTGPCEIIRLAQSAADGAAAIALEELEA